MITHHQERKAHRAAAHHLSLEKEDSLRHAIIVHVPDRQLLDKIEPSPGMQMTGDALAPRHRNAKVDSKTSMQLRRTESVQWTHHDDHRHLCIQVEYNRSMIDPTDRHRATLMRAVNRTEPGRQSQDVQPLLHHVSVSMLMSKTTSQMTAFHLRASRIVQMMNLQPEPHQPDLQDIARLQVALRRPLCLSQLMLELQLRLHPDLVPRQVLPEVTLAPHVAEEGTEETLADAVDLAAQHSVEAEEAHRVLPDTVEADTMVWEEAKATTASPTLTAHLHRVLVARSHKVRLSRSVKVAT